MATASSWCPAVQHRDVAQRRWPEELLSTGCSVWLGCPQDAFISRESSLALLVQEFGFFPHVTKSWKTPLNNISEHSWNKDRAQGESGNKTRDNQSCCCSLTSPTGGPDSPGEAYSGPSSFPLARSVPGLFRSQLQGRAWGQREPDWTRHIARSTARGKAGGKPGAKWARARTRQGGRQRCGKGLAQAHPTRDVPAAVPCRNQPTATPPPHRVPVLLAHPCTAPACCGQEIM